MDDKTKLTDFKEAQPAQPAAGADEKQNLLSKRINELPLKIQGTRLEALINKLYFELEEKGLDFKPKCYLSDEWGCPHGIPVIGIPFYLADPNLSKLEGELTGVEAESEEEIMMFLRHETGHAFNYAYKLYRKSEWRSIFGLFSTPYRENYKPTPFDPKFVRHLPGWYGQKHPDEDFAETFAVWLTPASNWAEKYEDTPALAKLMYISRLAKKYGHKAPVVTEVTLDAPLEELSETLKDWYETYENDEEEVKLPKVLNEDLHMLFAQFMKNPPGWPAFTFIKKNMHKVSQKVNAWTGIEKETVDTLIYAIAKKCHELNLSVDEGKNEEFFIAFTAFITTLVMNYLHTDHFTE